MKTLIYRNCKGMAITITNSMPFVLQKLEISNGININTVKGIKQNGNTYLNNSLDNKDINIDITITANTLVELEELKSRLYKVFNPKLGLGELIYIDNFKQRKIKCMVATMPIPEFYGNNSFAKCTINLIAFNPFFTDLLEHRIDLSTMKFDDAFHFPLNIDEATKGVHFGYKETSTTDVSNCYNAGDITTPVKVIFKSYGTVVNPKITNTTTNEFIKLNKTLTQDETIEITTDYGNKKVTSTVNNTTTNAFNLIDLSSTFMELENGDNLFKFEADTGSKDLECYIYYYNRYLGV
ncbi:Phage tail protein [Hathewaya proteolytica DSM 3090]|uniref:Phage tail protein n=1 Tax=Hathewaya proteolytica DSM 3090 TaxID=1121331 RepID=A0A1M6L0A6_9CLOT|nr:phage tail domain-containing protein [Hathewaya proteolytica]SHJ64685.1 Phage tail protein [Hathewaya proteolytica DSM 3090]